MASRTTSLHDFHVMARKTAAQVIGIYSTSFSLSVSLLPRKTAQDIRNLYALVRIADEIVDGTAAEAGLSQEMIEAELSAFEHATFTALDTGFSTNPILHAFAATFTRNSLSRDDVFDFFRAMHSDLMRTKWTEDLERYIHGSAEVIGSMCLKIFLHGEQRTDHQMTILIDGATRLGSAFQKINFLRDVGEDRQELGREYYPGIDETMKLAILDEVDSDLDAAKKAVPLLPHRIRPAVLAATFVYGELADLIRETPVNRLEKVRLSVPKRRKIALTGQAYLAASRRGPMPQ